MTACGGRGRTAVPSLACLAARPPGAAARAAVHSRVASTRTCVLASLCSWGHRHPQTMFLVRLTSQLLRVVPQAGKVPWGQMGGMHTHSWRRGPGHTDSPIIIQASQGGCLGLRTAEEVQARNWVQVITVYDGGSAPQLRPSQVAVLKSSVAGGH